MWTWPSDWRLHALRSSSRRRANQSQALPARPQYVWEAWLQGPLPDMEAIPQPAQVRRRQCCKGRAPFLRPQPAWLPLRHRCELTTNTPYLSPRSAHGVVVCLRERILRFQVTCRGHRTNRIEERNLALWSRQARWTRRARLLSRSRVFEVQGRKSGDPVQFSAIRLSVRTSILCNFGR